MTHITGILHLDNGEDHKFEATEWEFTFTWEITQEKVDELWEEMDKIITLA